MLNDSMRHQIAALPLRKSARGVEVLLITSRETKRWVIPKGWPMEHYADHNAARIEAYEEAGIEGRLSRKSIGTYAYDKRKKSGAVVPCNVSVFLMEVTRQLREWPEKDERKRRWFPANKAADLVIEEGLKAVIRATLI